MISDSNHSVNMKSRSLPAIEFLFFEDVVDEEYVGGQKDNQPQQTGR